MTAKDELNRFAHRAFDVFDERVGRASATLALVAMAVAAVFIVPIILGSGRPEPLSFWCLHPPQQNVERVLGMQVGESRREVGNLDRQASAEWLADGEVVVRVECVSVRSEEVDSSRDTREGTPTVRHDPEEDPGFGTEVEFFHDSAHVVIYLVGRVSSADADAIVTGWREAVHKYSPPQP